ncbi:HMG-box [Hesseltinella vesiculosa]|uniref:HMG-box n=1 Tax=Hesseltinella vesiculosa TaxID=101127 RepID=A0A1X2GW37_9FUNG|nr:HMG-box [Hesseltinella vesiculosa]
MEHDNLVIQAKLSKAQRHVKRLRMERIVLLEQLDEYYDKKNDGSSESDDSDASNISAILADPRMRRLKRKQLHLSGLPGEKKKKLGPQEPQARKKKDPNAPKGPGNVFFLYCRMERESFKDELQTDNLGEVTRLLGQKWKAMTDAEKKKYYDVYDREQEEYRKAMVSYNAAGGGDAGRLAVEEMSRGRAVDDDDKELKALTDKMKVNGDVDVLPHGDDDDDDDDDDLEEDEDATSFMDDASVATTTVSVDPPSNLSLTPNQDLPILPSTVPANEASPQ